MCVLIPLCWCLHGIAPSIPSVCLTEIFIFICFVCSCGLWHSRLNPEPCSWGPPPLQLTFRPGYLVCLSVPLCLYYIPCRHCVVMFVFSKVYFIGLFTLFKSFTFLLLWSTNAPIFAHYFSFLFVCIECSYNSFSILRWISQVRISFS